MPDTTRSEGSIWAVSSGSYSDYRVLAVFASEELAVEAAALRAPDGYSQSYEVEQLPYFDRLPKVITVHDWSVQVWDDGTTDEVREHKRRELEFDMLYPQYRRPVGWRWVRAPIHDNKGGRLEVFGTDLTRVRKVMSDTRAQLLADDSMRKRKEIRHG